MHVRLDDAGARVVVSTVRYPEGGQRRDEIHLYELPDPAHAAAPVHRVTREIDDVESVALSRDGERIAVGCGAGVCIQRWAAEGVESQLDAGARRRELGVLAFRPDLGLLVAAHRPRMEILAWELADATRRKWSVASGAERLKEALTPRFHGGPAWIPRWVGISPNGRRVASIRDDGTVSVWSRDGEAIKSIPGPAHSDMAPAFTPAGALVVLHPRDGRISAVDADFERVLLAVPDRPSTSVRRAALLFGGRAAYLATAGADGVLLNAMSGGALATTIPVKDPVWLMTISGDGRVVAVATQNRVTFWSLGPGS